MTEYELELDKQVEDLKKKLSARDAVIRQLHEAVCPLGKALRHVDNDSLAASPGYWDVRLTGKQLVSARTACAALAPRLKEWGIE